MQYWKQVKLKLSQWFICQKKNQIQSKQEGLVHNVSPFSDGLAHIQKCRSSDWLYIVIKKMLS